MLDRNPIFFNAMNPTPQPRIIKIDLKTNIRIKKETDEKLENFM
jgi:hypothetical protein